MSAPPRASHRPLSANPPGMGSILIAALLLLAVYGAAAAWVVVR